jgi:hypothetical protein
MGEVVTGEYVSLMVEYVRPVETVNDYNRFPNTDEPEVYGQPRTIEYYIARGLAPAGSSFYAVGMAIKNVSDVPIDSSTVVLRGEEIPAFGVFPSQSQRSSLQGSARGVGRPMVPGEVMRGETVFALPEAPETYTLNILPFEIGTNQSEQLFVDLGRGSDGTASFTQAAALNELGETVSIGDFDVTIHEVERVASVTDSPHQTIFGPREGFDYLRVDLSATRTSDTMIGQRWSMGMGDEGFVFGWSTVYQDALDLNRTRLEELSVGESIEHTILAFPVETAFEPTTLSMTAIGPIETSTEFSADEGVERALWSLA